MLFRSRLRRGRDGLRRGRHDRHGLRLRRGWVDAVVMRLADAMLSFPSLVLAIALAAAFGPSLENAMLAVAITLMPQFARVARAQAVSISARPYVEAAITLGVFRVGEATAELRRLYENSTDKEVRQAALEALAFMPTAETAPVFEQALSDREGHNRASAALALGRLKDEKYLSLLESSRLREKDEGVQLALAAALVLNGKRELLDKLVPALGSKFRAGEAEAYLIEAVRDDATRDGLYARLYHNDAAVRAGLCRVLAVSGDNRSISYLEVLLKDRNSDVVAAASRAIRILRTRQAR